MTEAVTVDSALIDTWADNLQSAVALHLRQELLPVEGKGGVIFPATYAQDEKDKERSPYTIDNLCRRQSEGRADRFSRLAGQPYGALGSSRQRPGQPDRTC